MTRALLALALTAAGALAPAASRAEIFAWVQAVPEGWEARAITEEPSCPEAVLDGVRVAMGVRAAPGDAYPILVCALRLPPETRTIAVAGAPLKAPGPNIDRIVILGDTGCRLRGPFAQACNDPAGWPFRAVADAAAAAEPRAIIHTGDYHYRETRCPAGDSRCAGSPFGDTWEAWREDFLRPAAALLRAAPWLFVRGNHEVCGRGGLGWTRAFDPRPFDPARPCAGPAEPFTVGLGGTRLAVLDVSGAAEGYAAPELVAALRPQYAAVSRLGAPTWLIQHRPIWSVVRLVEGKVVGGNETLAAASQGALPGEVALMISGHLHVFQALTFDRDLPPQLIVGHGGTFLDEGTPANPAGLVVAEVTDSARIASGTSRPGVFGFVTMERDAGGWTAVNRDLGGIALDRCRLQDRRLACESRP